MGCSHARNDGGAGRAAARDFNQPAGPARHRTMMAPVIRIDGTGASPVAGRVVVDWPKALWNGGMIAAAALAAPWLATPSALLLFAASTWLSLLIGHSVGMHRMMIHRSFRAPLWLERTLVTVGALVGMGGPTRVIRIHDERDWAQRQPHCHDFFAHRRRFWPDLGWQLFCRFDFAHPPRLAIEQRFSSDPWYRRLDAHWRWLQIALWLALYAMGGWSWLIWGGPARVAASVVGHWSITYWCHNPGPGRWRVAGAAVQACNLSGLGWLTFGECWHNNHHAFPESVRIGIEAGQSDPGWMVIRGLERLGLAWDVGAPRAEHDRDDLQPVQRLPSPSGT